MINFTIKHGDFLNKFFDSLKKNIRKSYEFTTKFIINPQLNDYNDGELLSLVVLNKSIFQNFTAFCSLVECKMFFSSLSCLENAVNNVRLFKVLVSDRQNLHDYIQNDDFDLDKHEKAMLLTAINEKKASEFSAKDFQTELSKWNKFYNMNATVPTQIIDSNIYLGMSCGEDLSESMQDALRIFIVGCYQTLLYHKSMFFNGGLDEELEKQDDEIFKLFMEYIGYFG